MQFTRKTGLLGLALGAIAAILWPLAARADSAASWTEIAFPIAVDEVVVAPTDPVVAYASTDAGVYRSADGGRTWLPTGALGQPPRGEQVVGIVVDPRSANTVYASTTQYGVYKSEDGGRTWIQLRGRGGVAPFSFSRIVVSVADPNVLFGAGDQRARVHGLFRSTDGGRSWTKVGPDFFPATEIAIAPNDPNTLYVSLNSQAGLPYFDFVKTTDGGDTWTSLARSGSASAGLPRNPVVYGIWIDPALPEAVFIATDLGVYISTDAGASWKRAASGLPESAITSSIAPDPA
ncbi:MAG: exo-alpha-sialidase, partial [Chloroflexi bacterium]|nr:exo-alpha-sialidase [Chloroflexota bacterium]